MKAKLFSKLFLINIVILLFVISCKKKENSVQLIFPINTEVPSPTVEFIWETNNNNPVDLKIIEVLTDSIILDTIGINSFLVSKLLMPDQEYKWIVKSGRHEEHANFRTRDEISYFEGKYEVVGTRSYAGNAGSP